MNSRKRDKYEKNTHHAIGFTYKMKIKNLLTIIIILCMIAMCLSLKLLCRPVTSVRLLTRSTPLTVFSLDGVVRHWWFSSHEIFITEVPINGLHPILYVYDINTHKKTNFDEVKGAQLDRLLNSPSFDKAREDEMNWDNLPAASQKRVTSHFEKQFGNRVELEFCGKSPADDQIAWLIQYDNSSSIFAKIHDIFPFFYYNRSKSMAILVTDKNGNYCKNLGYVMLGNSVQIGQQRKYIDDVRWLSNGRKISFIYDGHLWLTPIK